MNQATVSLQSMTTSKQSIFPALGGKWQGPSGNS